jgi:hypothetical protein
MNAFARLFKIDSVRRIDRVIDYFGEPVAAASRYPAEPTMRADIGVATTELAPASERTSATR